MVKNNLKKVFENKLHFVIIVGIVFMIIFGILGVIYHQKITGFSSKIFNFQGINFDWLALANVENAFSVDITNVTSSTVALRWNPVSGVASYNVYITPEPETLGNYQWMKLMGTTSSTEFVIRDVAAAVDTFIRVEAVDNVSGTGNLVATGDAYARTIGGQAVTLDNALRQVHMYGPNILLVVLDNKKPSYDIYSGLWTGNTGESWQAETWSVKRKNGSSIAVNNVFRHSIPTGQSEFVLGLGFEPHYSTNHDELMNIDHYIYLNLSENVGNKEVLEVAHTGDMNTSLNFILLFSDKYRIKKKERYAEKRNRLMGKYKSRNA